MTSQKFSANKQAARFDLKASYRSNIGCAVFLALCSAFLFIIEPLNTISNYMYMDGQSAIETSLKNLRADYEMILMTAQDMPELIGCIFIYCGALFALKSFDFAMKKKCVNVYFSSTVDRRTMFKNRVLSSVSLMAGILFIVVLIDAVINIRYFNHAGYIFNHALILWAESFVYALIGFSIAAIAASLCSTIVESSFFTGALVVLPSVIIFLFNSVCATFLRGYADTNYYYYYYLDTGVYSYSEVDISPVNIWIRTANFNPIFFSKRIGAAAGSDNIFSFVNRTVTYGEKAEYLSAGFDYVIPVIIWAAVCVALICLARYFYVNRKAENAGIHGSQRSVTAFFAAEASVAGASFCIYAVKDIFGVNVFGVIISAIAITFICYFLLISINRRTVKHKKSDLIIPGSSIGVVLIAVLIAGTGGFGWSSYVPDIEDIECAFITSSRTDAGGNQVNLYSYETSLLFDYYSESDLIGAFNDKDDLKAFTKVASDIAKKTDDMIDEQTSICYKLKNGKKVYRTFDTADSQALYNILSLTDTKAYREELEYLMTSESKIQTSLSKNAGNANIGIEKFFANASDETIVKSTYQKGIAYAEIPSEQEQAVTIKNTKELRQAILTDILNSTYEQRFRSDTAALGTIRFDYDYNDEYDDEGEYDVYEDSESFYCSKIVIYPSMTNTINYLKGTGEYKLFESADDKLPQKATVVKWSDLEAAGDVHNNLFYYHIVAKDYFNPSSEHAEDYGYTESDSEWLAETKTEMLKPFSKGQVITDAEQIKELMSKTHMYRMLTGKEYVVMFEYEDEYRSYIIPEKDMPSFIK